jgi:lauroyl/myristoyl acyltransferase
MLIDSCLHIGSRSKSHKIARFLGLFLYTTVLRGFSKYEIKTIKEALLTTDQDASRISQEGFLNKGVFFVDYQYFSIKPIEEVRALIQTVTVEGELEFKRLLETGRPLILISIHLDSFLIGTLKLCEFSPSNRNICIVKFMQERKKEKRAYSKFIQMGAQIRVLRLSEKPAIEIFKTLRNGHMLLILCDVDPGLGKTSQINFFGKSAKFPCGPIELAITSKAIIVPFVVFRDKNSDQESHILKLDSAIDPLKIVEGSFEEKTQLLTQSLATTIESWITQHPEQWQTWAVLQKYWSKS